ncbi:MAG TPA: 7TM diverse intracellular signaling domain-containing protein [Mucilaginibacter sp.]|nr:7TM diverse intracellular signaling domain-containing protein [Mucilaginibacter sp.]
MRKIVISFVLLLVLLSAKVFAQTPVVFSGENTILGKNVAILEDKNNTDDIKTVIASSKFVQSNSETPNLQLSKSSFWLKFTVRNESSSDHLILALNYPTLSVCDLYSPTNTGFSVQQMSDRVKFRQRKYKNQNFLFDIYLAKDSTATYYLHVKSSEQMVLPLILGTAQHIDELQLTANILWGIFIGLITVMVLYNFFIFLFTRDVSYIYYVLYSTFIGLTQTTLSGYTYRYLLYDSPLIFHKCIIIFPALAGISAMLFVESFLNTRQRTPKLNKAFPVAIFLYCVAVVLRLIGLDQASYRMIDISALITTAIIYIIAVKISLQGYRPAKFFLLAWTIFFAGIILFTLRNLGVLPYNNFTNYTMESGIAFEVTLLSIALADRINILKKEKEQSQAEALRIAHENERIIREQNTVLEIKVAERTSELNETLEDLKQAQAQLVESEKMASLGQLTAGIAHEINNPINFVTSNVSPLRRDIDIVFDAINSIETIGLSESSTDDKKSQLEAYKEDLDFDYLQTEIKHLLNGIYNGASRTAEIVKGLRVFSRLDEDDLKMADLNEGIDSSMIILNNLLNNRIEVVKEYGKLPTVECYPGKLNQVFLNILSNAIYAVKKQFGEESGGKITINTSSDNENVFITITDNGIGMDEATQKKIFDPFFTTKDVGEGTGLGMSIAYNTIKKHHGEIKITSSPGEGAEFVIKLPVRYEVKTI